MISSLWLITQEFSYHNEVLITGLFIPRKVSTEKKIDGNLENRQRHGSENQGYLPEELWNTEQIASESKTVNHILSKCFSTEVYWTTMTSDYVTRFLNTL